MSDRKRVLILTADAGFGHRSAANALAAAFADAYSEGVTFEIGNPFDDPATPAFLREVQTDYDRIVRDMPDLYKLNYNFSDNQVPAVVLERALIVMMIRAIRSLVKDFRPDVIITTHLFYMAPLSAYMTLRRKRLPFITVVTDLTNVHRLWLNQNADLIALPTPDAFEQGLAVGVPKNRMKVTGIPVNPKIANETRPKDEIRKALGWTPDVTTALVTGSKRIKGLVEVLHVLNHSGLPIQLALVAGGDDGLFEQFKTTDWHTTTYIYNYVKNMPELMRASDLIISKAGGLTVTESLACALPLLLVDVTPGQEEGNASYVVQHGAGELADSPVKALEIMHHWLDHDCKLLSERSALARQLGRDCSAYDVASLALEISKRAPIADIMPEHKDRLKKVKELLRTFDISFSEKK